MIGAGVALVLGGGIAFYVGLGRVYGVVNCGALSAEECAFEHETFKAIGRLQVTSGLALVGLGAALLLFFRKPREAAPQIDGGKS